MFEIAILTTDPIISRWIVMSIDIILAALVLVGLLVGDVREAVHATASLERGATSSWCCLASVNSIETTSNNVLFRSPLVLGREIRFKAIE